MSNIAVYYILHENTNSVYVGSTRRWNPCKTANGKRDRGRRRYHKSLLRGNIHPNEHLQKLWNDHNESEFQFIVYSWHDENISKRDLWDHEENLRKKFFSENKTVLNVMGTSNYSRSAEHREKLRQANLGKTLSEATRAKLSKANKGKTLSEETRKKISKAQTGRKFSEETINKRRGSKNGFAKLNEDQTKEIRKRINNGEKQVNIAKEFGVSTRTIGRIKRGQAWAWLE